MITFSIEAPPNLSKMLALLERIPGGVQRAAKSAVRRTLKGGKQDAGRKIAKRYTINARVVTGTIKTRLTGLSGELSSRGSVNPISKFLYRPKAITNPRPAGGIFISNVRGQGGNIRRGFVARMRSGHTSVFEREGRARLPIKEIKGPSSPSMLASPPVSSYIVEKMSERLGINLEHEIRAVLGGYL